MLESQNDYLAARVVDRIVESVGIASDDELPRILQGLASTKPREHRQVLQSLQGCGTDAGRGLRVPLMQNIGDGNEGLGLPAAVWTAASSIKTTNRSLYVGILCECSTLALS